MQKAIESKYERALLDEEIINSEAYQNFTSNERAKFRDGWFARAQHMYDVHKVKRYFDIAEFHEHLSVRIKDAGIDWKTLSEKTGVNTTTLARMKEGRIPDALNLVSLCVWMNVNPNTYMKYEQVPVIIPDGYKLIKNSTHAERSYPGGDYMGTCCNCDRNFIGPKRQTKCRVCATEGEVDG